MDSSQVLSLLSETAFDEGQMTVIVRGRIFKYVSKQNRHMALLAGVKA
jgi:hypothetical protein